jgi:hypothetical protein
MALRTSTWILTACLCAVAAMAGAQSPPAPAAAPTRSADWAGQFVTEFEGQTGQLSLLVLGSWMGGTYVENGEQFTVVGRIDGTRASGTVTDQYHQQAPFDARLHAAGLVVTLNIKDQNGVEQPVTLNFERPEAAAKRRAAAAPGLLAGGGRAGGASDGSGGGGGGGDTRLVGAWRATEAGRSGEFTWASDNFIRFAADGSCADGGGRTYAGGANASFGAGPGAVAGGAERRTPHRRAAGRARRRGAASPRRTRRVVHVREGAGGGRRRSGQRDAGDGPPGRHLPARPGPAPRLDSQARVLRGFGAAVAGRAAARPL